MERIDGAVALVTGGANGIGAALARRLAGLGVRVVIADVAAEAGMAVVDEVQCRFVRCDVGCLADNEAAVTEAVRELGGLDIVALKRRRAHRDVPRWWVRPGPVPPGHGHQPRRGGIRRAGGAPRAARGVVVTSWPRPASPVSTRPPTIVDAYMAVLTSGRTGECWYVQPGWPSEPFRFPGVPGIRERDGFER